MAIEQGEAEFSREAYKNGVIGAAPEEFHFRDNDLAIGICGLHESTQKLMGLFFDIPQAESEQEKLLNGYNRGVLLINGRRSPNRILGGLKTWFDRKNFNSEHSKAEIKNSLEEPYEAAARDVERLEPQIIFGHSMGGPIARRLGREYPFITHVFTAGSPQFGSINGIDFNQVDPLPERIIYTNFVGLHDLVVRRKYAHSTQPDRDKYVRSSHLGYGNNPEVRRRLATDLLITANPEGPDLSSTNSQNPVIYLRAS